LKTRQAAAAGMSSNEVFQLATSNFQLR